MNFIILVIILYYIFCHSLHMRSSLSQIKHLLTLLFVFSSPFAFSVNSIISSPLTSKVLLQGQISLPKLSLKTASLYSHHLPSALPPLVTQPAQIQNSKSFRKIFFLKYFNPNDLGFVTMEMDLIYLSNVISHSWCMRESLWGPQTICVHR